MLKYNGVNGKLAKNMRKKELNLTYEQRGGFNKTLSPSVHEISQFREMV